jgi:hypothetical protein
LITDKDELLASWDEPDIDEMVAHLELLYEHRQTAVHLGKQAGNDLAHFTWAKSAETLLHHIF